VEEELPPLPVHMEGRPFGADEQGRPIRQANGASILGVIAQMQDWVGQQAEQRLPAGASAAERQAAIAQAREAALDQLVERLNAAIPDRTAHVTREYLLNPDHSYSHEFNLYANEFAREICGDPDFYYHRGLRSIPASLIPIARPLSLSAGLPPAARPGGQGDPDRRPHRGDQRRFRGAAVAPGTSVRGDARCHPPPLRAHGLPGLSGGVCGHPAPPFQPAAGAGQRAALPAARRPVLRVGIHLGGGQAARRSGPVGSGARLAPPPGRPRAAPRPFDLAGRAGGPVACDHRADGLAAQRVGHDRNQQRRLLLDQRESAEKQYDELQKASADLQLSNAALQHRLAELTALHEIGLVTGATLDLDRLLDDSLRAVIRHLGFDRALILLVDEERRLLVDGHSVGGTPEVAAAARDMVVSLDNESSFLSQAVRLGRPVLVTDAYAGGRRADAALRPGPEDAPVRRGALAGAWRGRGCARRRQRHDRPPGDGGQL
jgi:hypothetical protein